jgi:hypothetical protein
VPATKHPASAIRGHSDNQSEQPACAAFRQKAAHLPAIDSPEAANPTCGLTLNGVNIRRILEIEIYQVKHIKVI